ncbi:MAG TPA: CDP-alcohol phosphatidyltransferase family protein [Tepidisphaeraceae bacterium]|nr:CDP-alcohol phosphatidyltransferase family protein [Tepidisphaeraceae bacterium]
MENPTIDKRTDPDARRKLKSRNTRIAHAAAEWLARVGVKPDWISLVSILFGVIGAGGFLLTLCNTRASIIIGLVVAIFGIQLRLICNLLDGMVAVEHQKKTSHGELFNDIPDRISDCIFFIAAGYAADERYGITLGWLAALLSVMTAYIRTLGRAVGANWYFSGPMAKQHRMAVMTLTCIVAAVLSNWNDHRIALSVGLAVIVIGCVPTLINRLRRIVRDLYAKEST